MLLTANRFHDFSYGHRVCGHETKCKHLHGHNGRIHFFCEAPKDELGRVIDFGVIKEKLVDWVEKHWDHKFLVMRHDPYARALAEMDPEGVVLCSFNPTAENMAEAMLTMIGPILLEGSGVRLVKVIMEETYKCSVTAECGDALRRHVNTNMSMTWAELRGLGLSVPGMPEHPLVNEELPI